MTEDEILKHLTEVIVKAKTKLDKAEAAALASAIVEGLRRRAVAIVDEDEILDRPDEHLQTLKSMRRIIRDALNSGETPARDLASLSRRLQDVSREVTTIEERHRDEKAERGGRAKNGSKAGAATGSGSGSLDI